MAVLRALCCRMFPWLLLWCSAQFRRKVHCSVPAASTTEQADFITRFRSLALPNLVNCIFWCLVFQGGSRNGCSVWLGPIDALSPFGVCAGIRLPALAEAGARHHAMPDLSSGRRNCRTSLGFCCLRIGGIQLEEGLHHSLSRQRTIGGPQLTSL